MEYFTQKDLKALYRPHPESSGEDNGQVTIIGGSALFHGAPLLSLKSASRIVDMVFFSSPDPSVGKVAENIKSRLSSFVWVPFSEVGDYIKKSDAVLIGPGFMRFRSEKNNHHPHTGDCDDACELTKGITKNLLTAYPDSRWVIDAGSLQVMDPAWIPPNAIITPNKKEYHMLFNGLDPNKAAQKYRCTIILKGPVTYVYHPKKTIAVKGGNAGLTKGGTGDVLAGLTVALYAKNDALLAAAASSYVVKAAADNLFKKTGTFYNSDDLAESIPAILK